MEFRGNETPKQVVTCGNGSLASLIRQASRGRTRQPSQARVEFLTSSHRRTDFFSIDRCYLSGNYFGLVFRPNYMEWIQAGQILCNQLSSRYHRVLPIPIRHYSSLQVNMIKYSLHIMLSLGSVLYVVFTDDPDYLDKMFATDNLLVVQNGFSYPRRGVWETGVAASASIWQPTPSTSFNSS